MKEKRGKFGQNQKKKKKKLIQINENS